MLWVGEVNIYQYSAMGVKDIAVSGEALHITINEEEYHFLIREAWLGEDYICEYETKDGKTIRYDHDRVFQRHKEKITANKTA